MWVYPSDEVRISPETTALLPQLPAESGTPKQPVPEPLNAGEAMPDGVAQQPERLHRRMRHASRDCCLLAAAFLLGTAAAGALQAVCDASQQEMLSYFLQCWCGLFSISAHNVCSRAVLRRVCGPCCCGNAAAFAGPVRCGAGVHLFVYDAVRPWQRPFIRAAAGGGRREKHPRFVAAGHSGRLCRRLPVHVRCISTAGERAHPGLLLPENGRTSLFRGAGTDGAVSAGDRGIFAAVRRSDRSRLSERKNPLTSAFLAMPPRVCYNKENG